MINRIYRLVQPRKFELCFKEMDLVKDRVIVNPTHLSICNADQRYYQGTRDAKVLAQKLPMALIHEAIGDVVYDPTGTFKPGETVVLIPNQPVENDSIIAENYLRSSKFRASGFDGFMQEYVSMSPDRLVHLPDNINKYVAAFTEIASVSVHAISRFNRIAHSRRDIIGIWGDGNLSYITCLFLKKFLPNTALYVFGVVPEKLNIFSFADRVFLTTEIPSNLKIDHAFECVGGNGSSVAINQIIDFINPEGTISILGVSEYPVPINTRMILEKGLRMFGSSRSGRADFEKTVQMYEKYPEIVEYLNNVISYIFDISSVQDIQAAFDNDSKKAFGKTIMVLK